MEASGPRRSRLVVRFPWCLGSLLTILICLPILGVTGATAEFDQGTSEIRLDPACVRFDDPNAVIDGEIIYADFTAYDFALEHALAAWSPDRGFGVSFREARPIGDRVPDEASLVIRDAVIPGSTFKGVTVTWSSAPATITLNRAELPAPDTVDPDEQELLRTVMTHELGHALGLGDVPMPGVNIRECGEMLMKRSVDKAGGRILEPQPADIALYCMRWGGTICGDAEMPAPGGGNVESATASLTAPERAGDEAATPYRYFVITCNRFPAANILPEQVERDELPRDPIQECNRAPAGVMFEVLFEEVSSELVLTDRLGEFSFQKPDGVAAHVILPRGESGIFPSLLGFKPVMPIDRIPAGDPNCPAGAGDVCKRVFVLVP